MTLVESILPRIQQYIDPDLWGDAWEVAVKCEERFEARKGGAFFTYFWTRWRGELIDRARIKHGCSGRHTKAHIAERRRRVNTKQLPFDLSATERGDVDTDLANRALAAISERSDLYDVGRMVASGMSIRHIAAGVGCSYNSVMNAKKAMRSIINAPGFAIMEPVKCA